MLSQLWGIWKTKADFRDNQKMDSNVKELGRKQGTRWWSILLLSFIKFILCAQEQEYICFWLLHAKKHCQAPRCSKRNPRPRDAFSDIRLAPLSISLKNCMSRSSALLWGRWAAAKCPRSSTHWMPPMGLKDAVFGMGESHDWHSPTIGNTSTNRRGTLMHSRMKRSLCGPRRCQIHLNCISVIPDLHRKTNRKYYEGSDQCFIPNRVTTGNDSTSEMGANIYTGYLTCLSEKTRKSWIGRLQLDSEVLLAQRHAG